MRYVFLVLGVLVAIVGGGIVENKDRSMRAREIPRRLEINRVQLAVIADGLRAYRREKGVFPSNNQGLQALTGSESFNRILNAAKERDLIARFRTIDGIPYSIWGEPFLYENRRGLPASGFADSGVDRDARRAYSTGVDKGIYVWSIGAEQQHRIHAEWAPRLNAFRCAIVVTSALLILLYLVLTVLSVSRRSHGTALVAQTGWSVLGGASIAMAIALLLLPTFAKTCYASSVNRPASDKLRKDYTSLITKYHKRGIISDSAREKLVSAARDDVPSF